LTGSIPNYPDSQGVRNTTNPRTKKALEPDYGDEYEEKEEN
jgi:hypothetical protein